MDGGAWWAAVHGVAESRTRLSDFTFTFHSYALEKEMATHSSVLAWRIPGTGGAWWAAVYGVAQSRTQLKLLSSSSSSSSAIHKSHIRIILKSLLYYPLYLSRLLGTNSGSCIHLSVQCVSGQLTMFRFFPLTHSLNMSVIPLYARNCEDRP